MVKNAQEIIARLGGTNAAARFFGVRPPSVTGWLRSMCIPDERLVFKAAALETLTSGWFSRQDQWPDAWREIWPELAVRAAPADQSEREGLAHG